MKNIIKTNKAVTPYEIRILRLMADGHSFEFIAAALGVSVNTVAFYMRSIYAKLSVHSKVEAVVYAMRQGWIE